MLSYFSTYEALILVEVSKLFVKKYQIYIIGASVQLNRLCFINEVCHDGFTPAHSTLRHLQGFVDIRSEFIMLNHSKPCGNYLSRNQ